MNNQPYDKAFQQALRKLKDERCYGELVDFEHQVWSEIANRDLDNRVFGLANLLSLRTVPIPVAISCAGLSILIGAWAAMVQASAYDKQTTQLFEQKYVESIHPVLMSASLSKSKRQ